MGAGSSLWVEGAVKIALQQITKQCTSFSDVEISYLSLCEVLDWFQKMLALDFRTGCVTVCELGFRTNGQVVLLVLAWL